MSAAGEAPFALTPEQEAIIETVKAPKGNLLVEAGAGCAKTSTLKLAARGIKNIALAVAFNKKIAVDLEAALPRNFHAKTMNGLGHQAWGRVCKSNLKLDDRKLGKIITAEARDERLALEGDLWDCTRQLVSAAMAAGLVPEGRGLGLVPDSHQGWSDVASGLVMLQEEFDAIWQLARRSLITSINQAESGLIDFNDQIYCSVMLGGKFVQYPVVFVDEDQDLSPLQVAMVEKSLAPNGRLVAVGDKHQAIYAFRGASGASAEALRGLRPADTWTELPLMTSFRVPQVIAERQTRHVTGFRAAAGNPYGLFLPWYSDTMDGIPWNIAQVRALATEAGEIAILCRNNAPLLSLAFKLIRQGVGVNLLGKDIGKKLATLVKKICPSDETSIGQFHTKLNSWEEKEISSLSANGRGDSIASVSDRADCIRACADGGDARTSGDVIKSIKLIFDQSNGLVTLSSIHRAKGLEWPTVVHLDPWRVPSKAAKRAAAEGRGEALVQELNLKYVCETRTKHTLITANLQDFGA